MYLPTDQIGLHVEALVQHASTQRKPFERRWYNNSFFDDGYHYRFVSRTTGRIVDLSATNDTFIPYRAIPKASRQIRGIANLLLANQFVPVVYPEKLLPSLYPDPQIYEAVRKAAAIRAKKIGWWIEKTWKDKNLNELLTLAVISAMKYGVSYIGVYPDAENEEIKFANYDAFDIYLKGELSSIYDSPFLIKACPRTFEELQEDEMFDPEQVKKLNPDNRYASSEIKEAYMISRFGYHRPTSATATVILKESLLKEYINNENKTKVASDMGDSFKGHDTGDCVIRQVFSAAGVTLYDKYTTLPEYPYVDFRMEPGPIYQVPQIERFIPANKTLDSVMSRIERYIGTMAVGAYMKRRGENVMMTNLSGGQILEYDQTPPVQMQTASLGGYIFAYIKELNNIIEEQGASTSALSQIPPGVKSGVAIESLKASEYANLKIPTEQIKKTIKVLTEKMLDIAADYFITPQTVDVYKDGFPTYFDVIGEKGMEKYKELGKKKGGPEIPNAITLKRDYKVDIEIETGMGYTQEGKKQTMQQVIQFMLPLVQQGLIPVPAIEVVIKKFLEIYEFGDTSEFMDALAASDAGQQMTEKQLTQIQIALAKTLQDTNAVGPKASQNHVMEGKVAVLEALKESGILGQINQGAARQQPIPAPKETINYKDAPNDIRRQMEQQAGFIPSQEEPIAPSQADTVQKLAPKPQPVAGAAKGGPNGRTQPKTA